jgi:hypothetical protein
MATAAIAQSNSPSVLDRVQNESDPELGELIRVALENQAKLDKSDRTEPLEIMRKVTVSYTRIKLFDQQIAEVSRRLEEVSGPAELRYELLLAKTELEAKLMTEVANLRELMGIIPRHAFEEQPVETLNTWLSFNVIDERVHVLYGLKPFEEWWINRRRNSAGLMSEREALDYVREQLKNKNNLPIRIDIYYISSTKTAAEDLHNKIVSLSREANAQMQTEVRTELSVFKGSGVSPLLIREGKISTLHAGGRGLQRPDGGSKPLDTGVVEPNDLEQHILWRLTAPKNLPLTFRIEYDEASTALARQTADKISAIAKDLGLGEVVDVERVLVDSVPESTFMGRWQAITKGDIQTIDIQPTGVCVFVQSPGSKLIRSGMSIPGRWFLTPKEIYMDIKNRGSDGYWVYRGHFDKKGNLVVDKGEIFPQGSFRRDVQSVMLFKKVY